MITADQLLNQGLITGSGSISLGTGTLTNSGTITAGSADQSDTISISGNLALAASSRLRLNLRGNDSNSPANDQLLVSGAAKLDGQLEVSAGSGYTPPSGTIVDILSAASISGDFNGASLPSGFSSSILAAQNGSPARIMINNTQSYSCYGVTMSGAKALSSKWHPPQGSGASFLLVENHAARHPLVSWGMTGRAALFADPGLL